MNSTNTGASLAAPPPGRESIDVTRHLSLVKYFIRRNNYAHAARSAGRGVDADDLEQVGALALMRAAQSFDPAIASWSTYAGLAVRRFLCRAIQNQAATVRVPVHRQGQRHREGTRATASVLSLDAPVRDSSAVTLGDTLTADSSASPDAGLEAADARRHVAELLEAARLTEQEQRVLRLRVYQGRTLIQVGEALGLTRQRIQQVEAKALAKLRDVAGVPHVRGSLAEYA